MPKLRQTDKDNFETMQKAWRDGRLALMDVKRVSDGASVAAICTVSGPDKNKQFTMTPLAIMVEGNPYELFEPPSSDDDDEYGSLEGHDEETKDV